MNVDDPFGRLQQRQQRNYETLRNSLQRKGVNSPHAAEGLLRNIRKRALLLTAILLAVDLAVAVIFPEKIATVVILSGLALLWLVTAVLNGHRHVRRYIREELSD